MAEDHQYVKRIIMNKFYNIKIFKKNECNSNLNSKGENSKKIVVCYKSAKKIKNLNFSKISLIFSFMR